MDGFQSFNLPDGDYSYIFVRIAGTNAAAQTLAITQLGRVRIEYQGKEIFNTTPQMLVLRTNAYFGTPENASAVGAAFAFGFIVPLRTKLDELNVLRVKKNVSDAKMTIQDYTVGAVVASGTISVFALYGKGAPLYIPIIRDYNFTFGGATTRVESLPDRNISELYYITDANLSQVEVVRDGRSVVNADTVAVDAFTDAFNRIETGQTFVELLASRTPGTQEAMADQTKVTFVTTAAIANLPFTYFAIRPLQPGS